VWVYILCEIPFLNITPEVRFAGSEIPFLNITPELGFAGGVATPWCCCIPSKRVVNAASCASMFDMSVLSLVAELAMLFSAVMFDMSVLPLVAELAMLLAMGTTAKRELVLWELCAQWGATVMVGDGWGLRAMGAMGMGATAKGALVSWEHWA
jgi:hypothetical protein